MRKFNIILFVVGVLLCFNAGAQQKPAPRPKPAAPGQQRRPPAPPQGQGQPQGMGTVKPGIMLDSIALSKQPVFTNLEEALRAPAKVYKLVLAGVQQFPMGIERLGNLQVLELYGMPSPKPPMPEMPEGNGDMMPPPPMPPMPPMQGGPNSELPKGLFDLANLSVLRIHSLNVSNVPQEIKKLKNLKVLDLNNNPINNVAENIGDLKGLTELRLSEALMPGLPTAINQCTKLKILETSTDNLPELKQLKELIFHARGPNIPMSIDKMTDLSRITLYVSFMQPGMLEGVMTKLTKIKELRLPESYLDISQFMDFAKLQKLEVLELGGVKVMTPGHGLANFEHLNKLIISNVFGKPAEIEKLYQFIATIPSKPEVTIKYNKEGGEYLKSLKNVTLIINDPQLQAEAIRLPELKGLIFGSAFRSIPVQLLDIPSLQYLDLRKVHANQYSELTMALSKMRGLRKLGISSDAIRGIMPSLNSLKELKELDVKIENGAGGQGANEQELGQLSKSLPNTKITFGI